GRLLDQLETAGVLDDTLIVVTSDHGEMLGDHWLLQKLGWWDSSYHVPLIVHDPRAAANGTRGTVIDEFTENIDVMPTILEWIGHEVPLQCDGTSVLPWVHGHTPGRWRDAVHWEWDFRDPVAHLAHPRVAYRPFLARHPAGISAGAPVRRSEPHRRNIAALLRKNAPHHCRAAF
ncbi:MAG: hypothetical protein EBV03_10670, partial [Proteobacteria bacterium]|nr:hypothetical protein [Pseudomonadota bacterium]